MKTTMTLSQNFGCSPFELFEQDCDEVVMTINYYILLGEETPTDTTTTPTYKSKPKQEERIRVNDKTATNGWF